jgi:membrane-associated phospholipid phosphatase
MPLALARALDAQATAIAAAMVGRSGRLDTIAVLLATHLATLHVVLLVLLFVGGPGAGGRRRREAALRTAAALPITIGAVSLVGRLIERERPFTRQAQTSALVEHAPGRSFPSRHSACAAAMTTVSLSTAPVVGALMGLGTLGLAISRVYTGLHYPSDVLGGWIIGVGIGIIARRKELPRVLRT